MILMPGQSRHGANALSRDHWLLDNMAGFRKGDSSVQRERLHGEVGSQRDSEAEYKLLVG